MKLKHVIISLIIWFSVIGICVLLNVTLTETTAYILAIFNIVVFGFYVTCIAILYNSSYAKFLYEQIDDKEQKRNIHILKEYFLTFFGWFFLSMLFIILSTLPVTQEEYVFSSSYVLGSSSVNMYCMFLIFKILLDGLVQEAKDASNK